MLHGCQVRPVLICKALGAHSRGSPSQVTPHVSPCTTAHRPLCLLVYPGCCFFHPAQTLPHGDVKLCLSLALLPWPLFLTEQPTLRG